MDDVRAVMDRADVVHVDGREQLAGDLDPAQRIEEDIPLVRIAQAERIGAQEPRRRNAARPVQREGVHGVKHADLHGVEKLEVADTVLRAERLESPPAPGLPNATDAPTL